MNKRISGIYCIENTITHKKYIGQSVDIYSRWQKHKSELSRNSHENDYLQKAWNKYGENSFVFTILEECTEMQLDEREIYYINYFKTLNRDYGYNLESGGQGASRTRSKETVNKLKSSVKKSYENDPSLKELRKESALKQWSNPSIKSKITGENNGMFGRHHTEEAKQKIREARLKNIAPNRNRNPVICIELNKEFQDAITAANDLAGWSGGILAACRGNRKTCGGYHWKFKSEK